MTDTEYQSHSLREVIELAKQAGELLMEGFAQADKGVSHKGDKTTDVVTRYDGLAQDFISRRLTELYPDFRQIGEEAGLNTGPAIPDAQGNAYSIIIDPLDGTRNFLKNDPHFVVSIGFYRESDSPAGGRKGDMVAGVIHQPATGATWWGDIHNSGGLHFDEAAGEQYEAMLAGFKRHQRDNPVFLHEMTGHSLEEHIGEKAQQGAEKFLRQLELKDWNIKRTGSAALDLALAAMLINDGAPAAVGLTMYHPWDYAAGAGLIRVVSESRHDTSREFLSLSLDAGARHSGIAENVMMERLNPAKNQFLPVFIGDIPTLKEASTLFQNAVNKELGLAETRLLENQTL